MNAKTLLEEANRLMVEASSAAKNGNALAAGAHRMEARKRFVRATKMLKEERRG